MGQFLSANNQYFGLLLPFVVALAVAGAALLLAGRGAGGALAGAAVPAGFLAAWLLLLGAPTWPASGPVAQVPYVAGAGLLLGMVADVLRLGRGALLALIVAFAGVAVWAALGWPLAWSWPLAAKAALLLGAWAVVLTRLEARAGAEPTAGVLLCIAALGLGAIAWMAGETLSARLAFALAAAGLGFLLWNWVFGVPLKSAAVLGGGGALVALAAALGLPGKASPWAVAALLLVFFADGTASRLPAGSGLWRRVLFPVVLALVALFPVAIALAMAYVAANMP